MKVLTFLTLLLAAALPTAADAACSTATLAGTWRIIATDPADNQSAFCIITVANTGALTGSCLDKTKLTGTLALNAACKITGTILGRSFIGRTEVLPTNSALKPNLIGGWAASPVGAVNGFRQ